MSKLNIMLVCSAGMSTSMLVKAVQKEVGKQGLEAEVFAKPSTEAIDYAESNDVSVLLLGPQVGFMEPGFKESLAHKNLPIAVMNSVAYGTMDGEKVLKQAIDLVNE